MYTRSSSRLTKLILAALLVFAGLFTGSSRSPVHADSPVTSTAIYKAYLDLDIVADAELNGLTRKTADFLAASGNPLDEKAAVINALYSDLSWSDKEHAEEYSQLVYGTATAALDKSKLSAPEIFVIGYLKVLDHYLDPDITWLTEAKQALPDSLTVALIHALALSQLDMDCSWIITEPVLSNEQLTQDLRPEAINIITDYMVLYKDSPCEDSGQPAPLDILVNDILTDAMVLSIGDSMVLVQATREGIDEAESGVVPYLTGGKTMVPLKFISSHFGGSIQVDLKKREATVVYNKQQTVIAKVEIRNGRTFVPLRAVMDVYNKQTYYHQGMIVITDKLTLDLQNQQTIQALKQIKAIMLTLQTG